MKNARSSPKEFLSSSLIESAEFAARPIKEKLVARRSKGKGDGRTDGRVSTKPKWTRVKAQRGDFFFRTRRWTADDGIRVRGRTRIEAKKKTRIGCKNSDPARRRVDARRYKVASDCTQLSAAKLLLSFLCVIRPFLCLRAH
uniref:Uncharacterized protein n=1 Tax=Plectus sambesii TaxID=2011161 RepID=A0A914XSD9_9BILA